MKRALLVALSLVVALGLAEMLARAAVRVDSDGQRWLGDNRVLPWRLPVAELENRLTEIRDPASVFRYDADLGWSTRPGARSRDGLFSIDGAGARRSGSTDPGDSVQRIVAVGDSFTFGDEVADDETWAEQLEGILDASGSPTEVINLGVNGYGVDQAVLRFERDGAPLAPDVVLLGLQGENLLRNLNVVRAVYFPGTSMPLSKPRFILDGDGLALVNQPTPPGEEVLAALRDPTDQPLLEHERWLDSRYEQTFLQGSFLISVVETVLTGGGRSGLFQSDPEVRAVGMRTIDRLAAAAGAVGARFVIVHLPRRDDLVSIVAGEDLWYGPMLAALEEGHDVLRPDLAVTDVTDEQFQPSGHYSPSHNRFVAEVLAERFGE